MNPERFESLPAPGLGVFWDVMSERSPRGDLPRPVIYQLLVRTFGNTNETRKIHGTLAENGCGKFSDINAAALESLRAMGFTHLWLTGVLEQASGTAYPDRPADEPDILKGIAGSPYAVRDYFDVCPDYADDPRHRIEEFRELVARCKAHGFRVLIDFVPNHVARSYRSDVRPELSFGEGDDRSEFFQRDNHFYYLGEEHPGGGPPLRLPTDGLPGCDGRFEPESEFGRVTGNNVVSWAPSIDDWYETVKLNYGHDFTIGRDTSHLPGPEALTFEVPKTWRTMDEIMTYWEEIGVDGFRVDMAHLVPMEFWNWLIRRARGRNPEVFFFGEAYDDDPQKMTDENVLTELVNSGFDAVYGHPAYKILKNIHEGGSWANDLDTVYDEGERFHHSVRYAENHDEVRLANPHHWGGNGTGIGKPVTAVLFAMSRGPVMLYQGQEVGEPGEGAAGFSGDDGRTSIFDYVSMPAFVPWVNGGKYDGGGLRPEQKELREWYGRMIRLTQQPAFTRGEFYGLNHVNKENPHFGRLGHEQVSGHWLYAFLRHDKVSGQTCLVLANLHGSKTLVNVRVRIPEHSWGFTGREGIEVWSFTERLADGWTAEAERETLADEGLAIPELEPCAVRMIEIGGFPHWRLDSGP
jgi:glycosidase